jgi:hypothetical protein
VPQVQTRDRINPFGKHSFVNGKGSPSHGEEDEEKLQTSPKKHEHPTINKYTQQHWLPTRYKAMITVNTPPNDCNVNKTTNMDKHGDK